VNAHNRDFNFIRPVTDFLESWLTHISFTDNATDGVETVPEAFQPSFETKTGRKLLHSDNTI